jgi:hypoxanthine phosphoribosyltransferase
VSVARRVQKLPRGLKPLISRTRIARRLPGLAREVHAAIRDEKRPIAIVVLQGAFIFAADLLRRLSPGFKIDIAFLRCESYGAGTRSSGRVLLLQDIDQSVNLGGRTVLLVDDILDSGLTLRFLAGHLRQRGAGRIRTCVLLKRKQPRGTPRIRPDFCGFSVGPDFVVGYGLDYNGRYRHLPYLAALKTTRKR